MKYAEFAVSKQLIAEDRIPVWPELAAAPRPKPTKNTNPNHLKSRDEDFVMENLQQTGSGEEEGFEVAESSSAKGKGKARSRNVGQGRGKSRSQPQQQEPAVTKSASQASLKRDLQVSPSREEGQSAKRPKKGITTTQGGLVLDGLDVNEGDLVSQDDVPKVRMKVSSWFSIAKLVDDRFKLSCTSCVGKRDDCAPQWFLSKGVPTIKCAYCVTKKLGCSFASAMDWGIELWPNIAKTQATLEARAAAAAAKLQSKSGGAPSVRKTKSEGSSTRQTTRKTRAARFTESRDSSRDTADKSEGDQELPIAPSKFVSDVLPVVESLPEGSQPGTADSGLSELAAGLHSSSITEPFQLEDFSRYTAAIRDPARSSASLGIAVAEVKGIAEREQALLTVFQKKITARAELLDELAVQLEAEVVRTQANEGGSGSGAGSSRRRALKRAAGNA